MSTVEIDFQFPDLAGILKEHERELNLFIAANVQFNRGMLFDNEGAYNGRSRWQDLSFRNGQILSKRGTLRKSIAPFNPRGIPGPDGIVKFSGDYITVGTKLMYARMMNDGTTKMPGGVLRPKNAKALKIPVPQGESAGEGAKDIQALHHQNTINKLHKQLDKNKQRYRRALVRKQGTKTINQSSSRIIERIAATAQKMGEGKGPVKFIFRKWVKIPERPFDDWIDADQKELDAALLSKIQEILRKGVKR